MVVRLPPPSVQGFGLSFLPGFPSKQAGQPRDRRAQELGLVLKAGMDTRPLLRAVGTTSSLWSRGRGLPPAKKLAKPTSSCRYPPPTSGFP